MSYEGYHSPQPYQQQGFNNSNVPYSNPQQPQNPVFQASYPDHYETDLDSNRIPPPPPPQNPQHVHQQPPPPPLPQQQPFRPNTSQSSDPFSDPSRFYQPQNLPINEAATSASQKADPSSYISPEVLSQITASVVQQLKGAGLEDNSHGQQSLNQSLNNSNSHNHHPQHTAASVSAQSDRSTQNASAQIYTPPSPFRPSDESTYSASPLPQQQHNIYAPSRSTPEPYRTSQSPLASHEDRRVRGISRTLTIDEETTLEKIWGNFFDRDSKPTRRLGQLLRGIAIHLIEKYSPENTIVITPDKMQKYYENMSVPTDSYPWNAIFDDRSSSISRLYREIQAEHHYVQEHLDQRPDIPALTPRGFERWATVMIQAHPEQEFERLKRTLLEMPINNPDENKHRFPKELPRRLFPKFADVDIKGHLEQAISSHCYVTLPAHPTRDDSQPAPRHRRVPSSAETPRPKIFPEDNRPKSYSMSATVEDEEEEEDEMVPACPIERERKPYLAQPGGGQKYGSRRNSRTTTPLGANPRYMDSQGTRNRSSSMGMGSYGPLDSDSTGLGSVDSRYGAGFDDSRYRDPERGMDRHEELLYGGTREKERDRNGARYQESSLRGNLGSEEDYYRDTGLSGMRVNGLGPSPGGYDRNSLWSGGYR